MPKEHLVDTNTGSFTLLYLKGAAFAVCAMLIWASWGAMTRLAVTTTLSPWDIAALRFGVAGILLAPVLLRRGLALDRLGWPGLVALIVGGGAPYALVAAAGLRFAPASDQGALNPGFMPLIVALIGAAFLHERYALGRKFGLGLILSGALVLVGSSAAAWDIWRVWGDALFILAACLWAVFTVVMRQAKLDPLHAAALVSTGSLFVYLPPYVAVFGARLADAPLADLLIHPLFQGVLVTIVSLVLYGRAVAILGALGGAAFGALVPALSALIAIPLLGEWPSSSDWVGILLVSFGVYFTSGGIPMEVWRATRHPSA